MTTGHAIDAYAAANELLSAKKRRGDGTEGGLLGYKKVTLAHSLGRVIDELQPIIKRYEETRKSLLNELGTATVIFATTEETDAKEYAGRLSAQELEKADGKPVYSLPKAGYEKCELKDSVIVNDDVYLFENGNGERYREADNALLMQTVETKTRIPQSAFLDIDFDGFIINEKAILKHEDDMCILINMLHDVVEA